MVIPGVIVMKRIFKDIKLLGRHITLGQQEGFFSLCILADVGHHHNVAGTSGFQENIPDPDIVYIGGGGFPLHRQGAGIGEGNVEIIFKGLIGVIV